MGYLIATLADQPDFAPSIKYFASFTLSGLHRPRYRVATRDELWAAVASAAG